MDRKAAAIDGTDGRTDGRTDTRPLHRPCTGCGKRQQVNNDEKRHVSKGLLHASLISSQKKSLKLASPRKKRIRSDTIYALGARIPGNLFLEHAVYHQTMIVVHETEIVSCKTGATPHPDLWRRVHLRYLGPCLAAMPAHNILHWHSRRTQML